MIVMIIYQELCKQACAYVYVFMHIYPTHTKIMDRDILKSWIC